MTKGANICPFCRTLAPTSNKETTERIKRRIAVDDAEAIFTQACSYSNGEYGILQNHAKALELWHRAGELGHAKSNFNTGYIYDEGEGVGVDKEKAVHYYELAAVQGLPEARHSLGLLEKKDGNFG